jgi:hypothetical protein
MAACNQSCFPSKIAVHLYVKNHMTSNFLKTCKQLATPSFLQHASVSTAESDFYFGHFLSDQLGSKVGPHFQVNLACLINQFWDLNSKLMSRFPTRALQFGCDPIPSSQCICHLPFEGGFFNNLVCCRVLGDLDPI